MTTQAQPKRKIFEAKKPDIATKNEKGLPYKFPVLVFPAGVIPNHGTYQARINTKEDAFAFESLSDTAIYRWTIEADNPKAGLTEADKRTPRAAKFDTDYWWHLVSVEHIKEAPAAPAPQKAAPAPPPPQTAATPQEQASAEAAAPRLANEPFAKGTYAAQQESIERQVAFKAAVELALKNDVQSLDWIATRFMAFLELIQTLEIQTYPNDEHEALVRAHLLQKQREDKR
jgi:hypothetical protein